MILSTTTTICEEQPRRRSLKRQRTKRSSITIAAATASLLVLGCQTSFVHSFQRDATASSSTRTALLSSQSKLTTSRVHISPSASPTSVYFNVDEYHASHAITSDTIFNNSPFLFRGQQKVHQFEQDLATGSVGTSSSTNDDPLEPQQKLPVWLREDKGHLMQENMDKLRSAMLSSESFFTETEAMKLTYAIREASQHDPHKMAGAAEFCLIMVETMEMGLNALVAGAFHYCECINARERSIRTSRLGWDGSDVDSLSHWEFRLPPYEIESFGDHAAAIERDAARLKRLEVVASMVIYNSGNNKKVLQESNSVAKMAADNLRNLYTTEAKDWRALAIRGAACLYRLRGILKEQQEKEQDGSSSQLTKEAHRVCREAFRIYAPLASRMGMHRLKNELEDAAFQILYRRQHRTYESMLRQTHSSQSIRTAARFGCYASSDEPNIGESMEDILSHVQETMTEFLKDDAVFSSSVTNFSVTARVKESYSTWKKMLRCGFDHITQVPDALALRIVFDAKKENPDESDVITRARERALCYYAQQLCKTVWRPYEGDPRFKDYIVNPKENGYQSLHYTAGTKWNNEDWRMEIQVRTGEMHKVAEFGVASHWNYKAMSKPSSSMGNKGDQDASASAENIVDTTASGTEKRDDPFGKVTIANNNQSSDAYLRSLQEWHWEKQHGSFPVRQTPLVLWDNEGETRERAERIRARTQRMAPYLEALANEQDDLQRKNVFVFLAPQKSSTSEDTNGYSLPTEGTVVALPAGASIVDALRKCDLPILPHDNANNNPVIRNGTPASLTSRLQNGDVLSIPMATACVTA
jgi:ppGpp synthetase/RelA/SpoT-type nucleotidyltranferase